MSNLFIEGAYPRQRGGLSIDRMATIQKNQVARLQGPTFDQYLSQKINSVNDAVVNADQKVADVTTGKSKNLHEMMVALNKAELSLKYYI